MRMLAAVAFSTAVLFSPLFAAAEDAPAPATATATAAPAPAAAPSATAVAPAATTAVAVAPTATAAADSSAVNLDEIVCRTVAAPTGSRLGGGRECHTVREWNERQRDSQDLTRLNQTRGFKAKGS